MQHPYSICPLLPTEACGLPLSTSFLLQTKRRHLPQALCCAWVAGTRDVSRTPSQPVLAAAFLGNNAQTVASD